MEQVDLAPTISMMLGLPIPYSSVGSIVPNFISRITKQPEYKEIRIDSEGKKTEISYAVRLKPLDQL